MSASSEVLAAEGVQARGWLIGCQIMSAVDAENVCNAGAAVAVAAAGGNLIGALRAEMVIALDVGAAGWTGSGDGLTQQEIEDGSDAAGHDDADHPHPGAHPAPWRVVTDIADQEDIKGGESAPGNDQVKAKRNRDAARVMTVFWKDDPEIILGEGEGQEGSGESPARDEAELIGEAHFSFGAAW